MDPIFWKHPKTCECIKLQKSQNHPDKKTTTAKKAKDCRNRWHLPLAIPGRRMDGRVGFKASDPFREPQQNTTVAAIYKQRKNTTWNDATDGDSMWNPFSNNRMEWRVLPFPLSHRKTQKKNWKLVPKNPVLSLWYQNKQTIGPT